MAMLPLIIDFNASNLFQIEFIFKCAVIIRSVFISFIFFIILVGSSSRFDVVFSYSFKNVETFGSVLSLDREIDVELKEQSNEFIFSRLMQC